MAYKVNKDGSTDINGHNVPVPKTVSAEAQKFLATSPWGDMPLPEGPIPMWTLRPFADAAMQAMTEPTREQYPVTIEEVEIAGVRCHLIRPLETPPENQGKALMNMHGGGFVMGSGSLVEAIPIAHLAKVSVVSVDYRLAPEHPYPAAVDDCLAVYAQMLEYHRPDQLGIYGASAGGFLTGQTLVRLQREGVPLPSCAGIFTAGGDLSDLGDTAHLFSLSGFYGDLILPTNHELSEIRSYIGGADPKDAGLSFINGDLAKFPPTLLMSGTRDALLSGAANLHRALRRAGVDADLHVFEAMPHAHWYNIQLPEAQEALQEQANFFLKHLKGPA